MLLMLVFYTAEVTPTPLRVNLKQMDVVLFKDADNKLKDSGK